MISPFKLSRFGSVFCNSHLRYFSTTRSTSNLTYGFIGLGQMGARMCDNLITKSGSPVIVYDKMETSTKEAASKGAKIASSPREVAEKSHVIITMLRSDDQVKEVYNDNVNGIIAGVKDNSLLIDSSTVNYLTTREIAQLFASKKPNVNILDAPVSGGIGAAQAGSLTFMCGGPLKSFVEAEKILKYMGSKIFHCGIENGSGQIVKISNNLILAISMCAVSEGMNLGIKLGMDPLKLAEIINVSSGRCWSSDTYNPCPNVNKNVPSSKNYDGGFVIDLMRKDLNLALNASKQCQTNVPLTSSVSQLYDMMANRGFGNKDFSFIYQFIKAAENDEKYTP